MPEFGENRDFRSVTLVDRTGLGGAEIIYDGVRIMLPRGKTEVQVPSFVARWLFLSTTQQMVWSREAGYTPRFGIKDLDEELEKDLGPHVGDTSPITIESRAEGWDTTGVDRADTRLVTLNIPRSVTHERQGRTTEDPAFGGRKG
mgnify:FL=1